MSDAVTTREWVGRSLRRPEDLRLVRGDGQFIDDLQPPGLAWIAFVRSPFAHAAIRGVDPAAARAMPGVRAVLTASDLPPSSQTLPLPTVRIPDGLEVAQVPFPILATDRVRFVGQAVAAVVADSPAEAADAVEAIDVDYELLPPVLDVDLASPTRTALHENAPDNVLLRWQPDGGDVARAFSQAAHVVSAEFRVPRLVAAPIEPRGCVASHADADGVLTLWCSAQDPHRPLQQLSTVLNRPKDQLRVIVPDVGGAFGSKGNLAAEHVVACLAAERLGRPIKWVESRSENFAAATQGRGIHATARLALTSDGGFLGLRVRLQADLGAYLLGSTLAPVINLVPLLTGVYDIPAAAVEVVGLATTKVPTGPYRGAGRPEAAFVIERLVDCAARQLDLDPLDLRRRNLIPADRFPYRNPLGAVYDSGDYRRALDRVSELGDYDTLRRRQAEVAGTNRPLGIGLSVFVESAGGGLSEGARGELGPDGVIILKTGSTAHGQGHAVSFAQIAADVLNLSPAAIEVKQGDSRHVPAGTGTYASRSLTIGGSAVAAVAQELKIRLQRWAAYLLRAHASQVQFDGAKFVVAGSGGRTLTLKELAHAAKNAPATPDLPPLVVDATFSLSGLTYPSGAYLAVVEIDIETGMVRVKQLAAVDDAGRIVNPLLAEGQVLGGAVQGLGEALLEEAVYDTDGQLMSGTFLSYLLPGAQEAAFDMQCEFQESRSPLNPIGAKGIAESGAIAVPPAIANAVADALSLQTIAMPFTPEKVWRLALKTEADHSRSSPGKR